MQPDNILIIDETGFQRVCASLLEAEGFRTDTISSCQLEGELGHRNPDLVITSYPYGSFMFERLKSLTVPVIVLSDTVSDEIINLLQDFKVSCCMVKPLDYSRFTCLVKELIKGENSQYAGFNIL